MHYSWSRIFPDAHNNLGNALREIGKEDEAILHYRAALRLKPDHPHAYNNLGNALKDKGMSEGGNTLLYDSMQFNATV